VKPLPKHCYKCDGETVGACTICGRPFCRSHGAHWLLDPQGNGNMCGPHSWSFVVLALAILVVLLVAIPLLLWYFLGDRPNAQA
jgi:hypothetical protein